jgi:uncharacterized membrane protein YkvA (DUF1232 family)
MRTAEPPVVQNRAWWYRPRVQSPSRLSWYARLKRRAARMKRQVWALFLAWKDPRTPVLARVVIIVAVAYAVSPIDLIPDFIPFFGQLDDLLILPLLIALAIRLIPSDVAARCRREAWQHLKSGDRVRTKAGTMAALVFGVAWIAALAWVVSLIV